MSGNLTLLIPILLPLTAAFFIHPITKKSTRLLNNFIIAITAAEFTITAALLAVLASEGTQVLEIHSVFALGISFELDGFRALFTLAAALSWLSVSVFSREYMACHENRSRFSFFSLLTLASTVGIFLSADLFTTFIFFEIMSFTSYTWVANDESPEALRAGSTYLAVAVTGGLTALMGLFLLYNAIGTLRIDELYTLCAALPEKKILYISGICILVGFGAKAGMLPLHIWLPKAYPAAPAPGAALLSGILTKSGIFGILAISCNIFRNDETWGILVLVLGAATMLLGGIYGICSIDLKKILACSSMSQIGFILVGTGMMSLLGADNTLAARGTILHMLNHSIFKLVLFSAAGVVFMNTRALDLNDIRGFGRKKPALMTLFLLAALGVSGIPLFSGYVSKTLLHESLTEYIVLLGETARGTALISIVEILFLISGGLTVAYMTKLFIALFIEKHPTLQAELDGMKGTYISRPTMIAIAVPALLIPVGGMITSIMDKAALSGIDFLTQPGHFEALSYFSLSNLKGAFISIALGAAIYLLIVRKFMIKRSVYIKAWPDKFNLEQLVYRPIFERLLPSVLGFAAVLLDRYILDPVFKFVVILFGFAGRLLDSSTDGAIYFMRKSVYCEAAEKRPLTFGEKLVVFVGGAIDGIIILASKISGHSRPSSASFSEKLEIMREQAAGQYHLITKTLSFSLLMVCVGLCATMAYLLLF